MDTAELLDERQKQVYRKGTAPFQMDCNKDSLAGAVSQRACVFCGSRVVLYPIADALHLVHGPVGCAVYTWDIRGALSSGPELHRLSFSTDLAPGAWKLEITFDGILNDDLRGFYRSVYTDPDGVEKTIATTQFEATEARRSFPCWDEPDLKAVFEVTLVVPTDLLAISCSAEVGAAARDKGVASGNRHGRCVRARRRHRCGSQG